MPEIDTISWRDLTGNKFLQGLNPAILSEDGYIATKSIRRTGDAEKTLFKVVYDREYLITSIGKRICKTLFILGKEKTLELVSEAWDSIYSNKSNY